jgi:hypothetical protein
MAQRAASHGCEGRVGARAAALSAAVLVLLLGGSARAAPSEPAAREQVDGLEVQRGDDRSVAPDRRPFAFAVDPSTPAPGTLAYGYAAGVGSGISAARPIPVVLQSAGAASHLSVGYGLTERIAPILEVTETGANGATVTSATVGVKVRLTGAQAPVRAAVLLGALHEGASGANGMWARAAASWGTGPILVTANGYAERVLAPGRDSLDYALMAGASWRLVEGIRAGAEWVAQDVEELVALGAEGGARQAAGPSIAFDLDHGRYHVVAAALFGIGALSPTALVRIGLLRSF